MKEEIKNLCECQFDLNNYTRDDSGFWINCTLCGKSHFFDVDTENELFQLFGVYDDDE